MPDCHVFPFPVCLLQPQPDEFIKTDKSYDVKPCIQFPASISLLTEMREWYGIRVESLPNLLLSLFTATLHSEGSRESE